MSAKNNKPVTSALDRLIMGAIGDGRPLGSAEDPAREQWPELWRWLTETDAGRDYIKKPARLTISMGPEGVLLSMVDGDLGCTVDATCANLADAFSVMDATLKMANPPIKMWGKKVAQLKKRKIKS